MRNVLIQIVLALVFFAGGDVFAQNLECFSEEESKRVLSSVSKPSTRGRNKSLRKKINKMASSRYAIEFKLHNETKNRKKLLEKRKNLSRNNVLKLCEIYGRYGWLTEEVLGKDGLGASTFIIQNAKDANLQAEWIPILLQAAKQKEIKKDSIASMIDKIRVKSGKPQIFGTQISIRTDAGYLIPLLDSANVDKWRGEYDLNSLNSYLREVESHYDIVVLRERANIPPELKTKDDKTVETVGLGLNFAEDDLITVETEIVTLNLRILGSDFSAFSSETFQKEDFEIFENNVKQSVDFFSTTKSPFDLVLVLDLSPSTLEKRRIIWLAVSDFVRTIRPSDRAAIVTQDFDGFRVLSGLTENKDAQMQKVRNAKVSGVSSIWDGVYNSYEMLAKLKRPGRRQAIVLMSDGLEEGSQTAFSKLLGKVGSSDATVFSIHVDSGVFGSQQAYRTAKLALPMLAEESGGTYHRVEKYEDLSGVYGKIADELRVVYSIGYQPLLEMKDGSWRKIKVKIKGRPNLIVRTKKGYYAN